MTAGAKSSARLRAMMIVRAKIIVQGRMVGSFSLMSATCHHEDTRGLLERDMVPRKSI